MIHHIIAEITILLLVAVVVGILAKSFRQHYTTFLVLVGLLVSFFKLTPHIHIDYDTTFCLILPPLLFHGALHVDLSSLSKSWKAITMLAIPGVVVSTLLIGTILHFFIGLPYAAALLFGALITPTDPISALSILNKVGAPSRLRHLLEGESLFNDGTGVVVFTILLGIATGQVQFSYGHTLSQFVLVTLGGTIAGLVMGLLCYTIIKKVDDHLLETSITVVLTFGAPLLAEYFHLSGIITIVVAGLIIGNYGRLYSMSDHTRETLDKFWHVIGFVINSILFVLIGVELQVIDQKSFLALWQPIVITLLALFVSRALVVYPTFLIKNWISPDHRDLPWKWSHVVFWGGLKGSISIALVVGLPVTFPYRELFLTIAFSVVLFSLVIQALTIKPLVNMLKIAE